MAFVRALALLDMVILGRLQWLKDQIEAGRAVSVYFSANADGKDKVRFVLEPAQLKRPVSVLLLAAVDLLASTATSAVVVDRGHRHSSGRSEVSFWLHRACATAETESDKTVVERLERAASRSPVGRCAHGSRPHAQTELPCQAPSRALAPSAPAVAEAAAHAQALQPALAATKGSMSSVTMYNDGSEAALGIRLEAAGDRAQALGRDVQTRVAQSGSAHLSSDQTSLISSAAHMAGAEVWMKNRYGRYPVNRSVSARRRLRFIEEPPGVHGFGNSS